MSTKNNLDKCLFIFVQYKIFVPILLALVLTAAALSYNFGRNLSTLEHKVSVVETNFLLLKDIKSSIDTLITLQKGE